MNIPRDIMPKDISVPIAPNNMIVIKFRKNCFFFTWNLTQEKIIKSAKPTSRKDK